MVNTKLNILIFNALGRKSDLLLLLTTYLCVRISKKKKKNMSLFVSVLHNKILEQVQQKLLPKRV